MGHETPHGRHAVYRWPADIPRPSGHLLGVVTRWRHNGYLVAASSRIGSAVYRLRRDEQGEPLPIVEFPPAWVEAALGYRSPQGKGPAGEVPTGKRHPDLVAAAKYLAGRDIRGDALFACLSAINAEFPGGPKPASEVRDIVTWADATIIALIAPPAEPTAEPGETTSIGSRTALDLRWGAAPLQLADPYGTPEGATVVYGRGGTGKGLFTCLFTKRLVAADHVAMIVDFEGHEREWGSRLRGLGLTDEELERIHYRAPFGDDWTAKKGALSVVAELIREDATQLGVTYIIVDSYSVATSNGDTMGGEQAAREYFSALARIGLPSLTIAHVRGDSGQFPDRPFGSVFVHNLARETWAVEQIGQPADPDTDPYAPAVIKLELRNKKANSRALSPAQFVTFAFYADGTITATTEQPAVRSVADLAADVLSEGALTLPKIAAAIKEDTGRVVTENSLRQSLTRDSRRFVQCTGKRPRAWSLR